MKEVITEEMHLQDEWFKKAESMKPDDFTEFFRKDESYENH